MEEQGARRDVAPLPMIERISDQIFVKSDRLQPL
jgi:hypothetical protein